MATTNYPASLDAYPVPNNGDTISVSDHWLGPAVIGIETELGTDPAGTFTDVKSRLDDVDDKVITEIDQWYLTANTSASGSGNLDANWSRWGTLFSEKGTGLSQSSGHFQFPSTGYYKITAVIYMYSPTATYVGSVLRYSTDDFGSVDAQLTEGYNNSYTSNSYAQITLDAIVKITDTANQKIRFAWAANAAATVSGGLATKYTGFTSVKIGEL